MSPKPVSAPIDHGEGTSATRPRPSPKIVPRLEHLETRCLLSQLDPFKVLDTPSPSPAQNLVGEVEPSDRNLQGALGRASEEYARKNVTTEKAPSKVHKYHEEYVNTDLTRRSETTPQTFPKYASVGSSRTKTASAAAVTQNPSDSWSPAPVDPPSDAYLIVPEQSAPHSSVGTAQALPDVPYFGVIGSLGPDDSLDVYRLSIGAGGSGLQFDLVSRQQSASAPLQFSLFDSSGRVLSQWSTAAGASGPHLDLQFSSLPAGTTLYLGVSTAGSAIPGSTLNYQLWVTQVSGSNPSPDSVSVSTATSGPIAPLIATPFSPAANASSSSAPTSSDQAPSAATSVGRELRVVSGSLPARSADPVGGSMSDDSPTPAARRLGGAVNLDWVDRSLPEPAQEAEPHQTTAGGAVRDAGREALLAVRGAGGYPLMGASATGSWGRAEAPAFASAAEPFDGDDPDSWIYDQFAAEGLQSTPVALTPEAESPRVRSQTLLRVSLSSGLGLATVLTLNAMFSDPAAGFDYLATRLDSYLKDSIRSRSRRRPIPRRDSSV